MTSIGISLVILVLLFGYFFKGEKNMFRAAESIAMVTFAFAGLTFAIISHDTNTNLLRVCYEHNISTQEVQKQTGIKLIFLNDEYKTFKVEDFRKTLKDK